MSVATSLAKQLVREQSTTTTGNDVQSDSPSLSEIKAAAKEGAAEALAEYHQTEPETEPVDTSVVDVTETADSTSRGGSSLKKAFILGLAAAYLLRRRRSGSQSSRTQ
jgi:hypothetical protein